MTVLDLNASNLRRLRAVRRYAETHPIDRIELIRSFQGRAVPTGQRPGHRTKLNPGGWVVVFSHEDLGAGLVRHLSLSCESAIKANMAPNIVMAVAIARELGFRVAEHSPHELGWDMTSQVLWPSSVAGWGIPHVAEYVTPGPPPDRIYMAAWDDHMTTCDICRSRSTETCPVGEQLIQMAMGRANLVPCGAPLTAVSQGGGTIYYCARCDVHGGTIDWHAGPPPPDERCRQLRVTT